MPSRVLIEVCVDSVESAVAAVNGGADRLELCGNLGLGGGTTPSLGLFKSIKRVAPDVPIMVMIRPHDIESFKDAGADGVVFGVLQANGWIDVERTRRLVHEADGMQAFDMTPDPDGGPEGEYEENSPLRQLVTVQGITRILTSGRGSSAPSSTQTLRRILQTSHTLNIQCRAPGVPLNILPGSGVNPDSVGQLLRDLLPVGLKEIHLSGGSWCEGGMLYRKENMGMGLGGPGEWGIWRTSESVIREVRKIADEICINIRHEK
ncbi:copper homeostasis CutC domain-containing protein [Cristinia sonorae]|uniref:Copper homeostasis protein cutC homolog n=1 Tax=Cristinia sonorae TaxID=1940300 RepID=A0A8K0XRZ1_9AGAR|nr:copper homeostasis CutC domain-containing protein [Cristinia sonorae]